MCEWSCRSILEWGEYVNKEVTVTARDEKQHRGWVYTVDPVSASIVLVNFLEKGQTSVRVVMGHTVEKLDILREGDMQTSESLKAIFLSQETKSLTAEELRRRKDSLRLWLEKNRIPVEVHGDTLQVANVLQVTAPYRAEDCSSPNAIILSRVQSLVESNPDICPHKDTSGGSASSPIQDDHQPRN